MSDTEAFVGAAFKLQRLLVDNERLAAELIAANGNLLVENKILLSELNTANHKIAFQESEKAERASELKIANKELDFQKTEKGKRAEELVIADKELAYQKVEKSKRAAELIIADQELAFQQAEKGKRAAELIIADKELAYEIERGKRASELTIANKLLATQNVEMGNRATELAIANKEKIELLAQLLQSQKMESLGILAGGVAHDMNNILGAILSLASAHMITQPKDNPAYPAFETMRDAALRGREMVKRLLNFSRQGPCESRLMDLNVVLLEQIRLLEHTTLAKVQLELDLDPTLRFINGDASALSHALMNLCVNSVDAMEDGGTLSLRTRNGADGQVEVEVEDSGCGMAKEVLDRAMVPFFTTKEVGKGTGLGLSIVYSTVKAHDGQLTIDSKPGQGTRVLLQFPAALPVAAEPESLAPMAVPKEAVSLHVLVVDDDDLIRRSTQMLLELLGHTVTVAICGEEAIDLLAAGLQPQIVILDMNMPGLGGRGTLPRLRELRPTLPVLVATGRADQKALDLVAAHAGVALLSKPFTVEELQAHLRA